MNLFLAVTDNDWFRFLRSRAPLDEVNFWRSGGEAGFQALQPGERLLFKLHSPEDHVVGGGFFAHVSRQVPVSLAWEAFEERNGATSYGEMRRRIEKYRRIPPEPHEDYRIGCILLSQPFFFPESEWIEVPRDWSRNIVQGKTYDTLSGEGARLWEEVRLRLGAATVAPRADEVAEPVLFGEPYLVRPRLGQGSFRVLVTDLYQRRCSVTGERALPVRDAAHIRAVKEGGSHVPSNGLLLRSDVHRLFDSGYVTVTPEGRFRVSRQWSRIGAAGPHPTVRSVRQAAPYPAPDLGALATPEPPGAPGAGAPGVARGRGVPGVRGARSRAECPLE